MKKLLMWCILCGLGFSQVLQVDSIIEPNNWTNPESVFVSDNHFATTVTHMDRLMLRVADPTDTSGAIDSVMVFLEQYVSDETRARWLIAPSFNGVPGTATAPQFGTETESVLAFDISVDITGWSDILDLELGLTASRQGGGAAPDWYADYIYVAIYPGAGISEGGQKAYAMRMIMPTVVRSDISFTYTQLTSTDLCVDVYNVIGEKVYARVMNGVPGTMTYTLSGLQSLATGVYYLIVRDAYNRDVSTGKFLIIH